MFTDGGIFIPSTRSNRLGDDVYVLLALPDDLQRYPVAGKVAWINPAPRPTAPRASASASRPTRNPSSSS